MSTELKDNNYEEETYCSMICNNKISFVMSFLVSPTAGYLTIKTLIFYFNSSFYFYFSFCILGLLIKQIPNTLIGFSIGLGYLKGKEYFIGIFYLLFVGIFGLFFSPINFIASSFKIKNKGPNFATRACHLYLFLSNSFCNISLLYCQIYSFFDTKNQDKIVIITFCFTLVKNAYSSYSLSEEINVYEYSCFPKSIILFLFVLEYFSHPVFFGALSLIYRPHMWWILLIAFLGIGFFSCTYICKVVEIQFQGASFKDQFTSCGRQCLSMMFCCMPYIPVDFGIVSFVTKFLIGLIYLIWFSCLYSLGFLETYWKEEESKYWITITACISFIIWLIIYLTALFIMKPCVRKIHSKGPENDLFLR